MTSPGAPSQLHLKALPLAVFGLNLVISLTSVPLSAGLESVYDTVVYASNALANGVAGLLILLSRPRHPMGWLLSAIGLSGGLVEAMEGYGYHATWPAAKTITWVETSGSFIAIGATVLLPLIFPTGHLPSSRWRPALWTGIAGSALGVVSYAFGHVSDPRFQSGVNPYAISGPVPGIAGTVGGICVVIALLASISSIVVRFRRSAGDERLQLKWFVYALSLLLVAGPPAIFWYEDSVLVQWMIGVAVVCLPIAVCIAILRYRLYDIDVLISATLVYGALTAALAGAYLLVAWALGTLVGSSGGHPSWVTAAATVTACAVFLPLRRLVQDAVDRRFRRSRHDALAQVDTFLEDLRIGRAAPEDLEGVLQAALARPDLLVQYRLPGAEPESLAESTELTSTTVERAGVELAVVQHSGSAPPLLSEVLAHAGLAIEIARLRAEVEHQLTEVRASRARIVAAGNQERRRLERDLHDGAQQRLVTVGLALRHAQHQLGVSPVSQSLEEAVGELGSAIRDLRELANGVRPADLDHGLEPALRELASRTPMRVDLLITADRYPADVEAAAYFVACEALTNAVKHSAASEIALHVQQQEGHLELVVRDDGIGGARPARGSGLRGLSDRVLAQGGALDLQSEDGAGTTLTVRLPCAS